MILLMGHHGFRVSDVAWLKVEDVTDDHSDGPAAGWARVTGKGGVVRQVPLTAEAMVAVRRYAHPQRPSFDAQPRNVPR